MAAVDALTGVYHADGSLLGELRYLAGRARGTTHCALCDITHGRLRERPEWRAARDRLPVPFRAVHLDERTNAERAASDGHTPCVLAHRGAEASVLLGPTELDACAGSPDALVTAILVALRNG